MVLCCTMIGRGDVAAGPNRLWPLSTGAVLAVVSSFWALAALTAVPDQW